MGLEVRVLKIGRGLLKNEKALLYHAHNLHRNTNSVPK